MPPKAKFERQFSKPIDKGMHPEATPAEKRMMRKQLHVLHVLTDDFIQRRGPEILTKVMVTA